MQEVTGDLDPAALEAEFGIQLRVGPSGKVQCEQCNAIIVLPRGDKSKAIRQHLKSHKKLGKRMQLLPSKTIETPCEARIEKVESDRVTQKTEPADSQTCWLCLMRSPPSQRVHPPFASDLAADSLYCCAPLYSTSPSISSTTPFFTKKSGKLPDLPNSLTDALDQYCVGKVLRLPNVDIDNQHIAISSLNQAGKLLLDASAHKKIYWAAFAAPDLVDPSWWPTEGEVPGYTQVIIGSGATDIGVHQDKFFPPENCDSSVLVNTYITISHGMKQVLMLPPTCPWISELPKEFPRRPSWEFVERVIASGGFFFELRAGKRPVTLFVPKGWWHWLLGGSEYALIFGSSRF